KRRDDSTRSGVLTSPSRSGSSPSAARTSRILSANGSSCGVGAPPLFPFEVDIVPRRLPEAKAKRQIGRQHSPELAPTHHRDVLRCWNELPEPGHVEVQVLVIEMAEKPLLRQVLEMVQIHHVARARI